MNAKHALVRTIAVLAIVLLSLVSVTSAQGNSQIRFAHVIPGASPIDIYINGTLTVTGLSYGEATGYIQAPAGDHSVVVTPTGITTSLWQQNISLSPDSGTTFIASSPTASSFDAFPDDLNAINFGSTRLLLVHAIANGPTVDVVLAEPVVLGGVEQAAGTAVANGMVYGSAFGAFDLPAESYIVNVIPTGGSAFETILSNVTLPLASGTTNMAIVYGTPEQPAALLLSAPVTTADSGFVRFVHGVGGGPVVDIIVDDMLVVPSLSSGSVTPHLPLPGGDHSVILNVAGTDETVATGSVSVTAVGAQTLVALTGLEGVELSPFVDNVASIMPSMAAATVINALPNSLSISASLADGTGLGQDIAYGFAGDTTSFSPVTAGITLEVTLSDTGGTISVDPITFYGGTYYNIIALDGGPLSGPQVVVAPTTLAQGVASAPGSDTVVLAPEVAQPPAAATPVPAASTPAPVTQEDVVTARVVLDPGANLQLRELPDANARSLGLAPSGSTLIVNGREGRPVALVEGQDPPPEAEDYVDPAEGLAEDEDLAPESVWLNVTYTTPDGGTITAWVNALYLEVRDERGNLQRLADLEPVGGNIPGSASNTAVTPPPIPEDRVTGTVFNLNPDANLNVRRTPETAGEVLVRLPINTVMEVNGFIEADADATETEDGEEPEWAFVTFSPAEGGTITGWVSTLYIFYEYNGRRIDFEEIEERGLLERIPADTRGEIRGSTVELTGPTPDPTRDAYVAEVVLDPGANLQFRRTPDAQSESLNLIPSGTRVIVTSRTGDGLWLETSYEGEEGWIASQFVTLSFNGDAVEIEEIPVNPDFSGTGETETDSAG